jgi:glycosyltransferase involved in cell wall biosynthesis
LLQYLAQHSTDYDAFVFFTYLYCTTYYGLPLVSEKAVLVPTAHDEPPIYLSIFDRLFALPRRMVFLTPEEREFVLRRFCLPETAGYVAGVGLDLDAMSRPAGSLEYELPPALYERIGRKPYLLYVGRIDEGKGCHTLIEWFRAYNEAHRDNNLQLVLAGRAAMDVAEHQSIITTGYLSETQKHACMDHAIAVVTPSPYESLCLAALEAWVRRQPVLANGRCAVLAGQCRRSEGGLWYRDFFEFSEALSVLTSDAQLRHALGQRGHDYVWSTYSWDKVEDSYISAIATTAYTAPRREIYAHV